MRVFGLRIIWVPGPDGRGAVRLRDGEIWEGARWCRSCRKVGYDHNDVDARVEAERIGEWTCIRVVDCVGCGAPVCDLCARKKGTMCRTCFMKGPGD